MCTWGQPVTKGGKFNIGMSSKKFSFYLLFIFFGDKMCKSEQQNLLTEINNNYVENDRLMSS